MSDRRYVPVRSTSQYPKAFNAYWSRVDTYIGNVDGWQSARVKRLAFNAWKAGRRS